MIKFISFFASFLFALAIASFASAQETKPIGEEEANTNAVQEKLVKELEGLQNQIALIRNDDKAKERESLYEILKTAESEAGGKYVADFIWRNWIDSAPTSEIAEKVAQAMERRRWYDYEGARVILNDVVKEAPDYSEGWNQRAYILFLQEKFDESLSDIEKAVALEPKHFAALSGKARILFHQGKHDEAREVLEVAVDIHPWIYERFLLVHSPKPGSEPAETKENRTDL